jgi:beta-phosphoglucomutase-like phosphatase (HAD superfamily)
MLQIEQVKGVLFDVDDTLLDNGPLDKPELWTHSRSRLAAIHEVAEARGVDALLTITPGENANGFTTAPVHSLRGGIWNILFIKGLVATNTGEDADEALVALVEEIADRKNDLHEVILREFGVEVPGAAMFVRKLAAHGLAEHMGLATSAIQRDVAIFLDKYGLAGYFPSERRVTIEQVTHPKPDPECFDKAFRTLGLPDEDRRYVLAFEDSPKGIMSAKAAGLFACALTTRFAADDPILLASKPDIIADSYAEYQHLLGLAA